MDQVKTPWHLWVVGIVTLLWNGIGAMDYVMTQTRNENYMAAFTPEQLDFFYSFPTWTVAAWAIAIWFSLLGSILLLLRHRWAVPVFAISFVAICVTTFQNFILSEVKMTEIMGPSAAIISAVIFVVAVLLVWYSRAMTARGVLR